MLAVFDNLTNFIYNCVCVHTHTDTFCPPASSVTFLKTMITFESIRIIISTHSFSKYILMTALLSCPVHKATGAKCCRVCNQPELFKSHALWEECKEQEHWRILFLGNNSAVMEPYRHSINANWLRLTYFTCNNLHPTSCHSSASNISFQKNCKSVFKVCLPWFSEICLWR